MSMGFNLARREAAAGGDMHLRSRRRPNLDRRRVAVLLPPPPPSAEP